jgi:hypothetical protein
MRPGLTVGVNVDPVNIPVGLELAARFGYDSAEHQMIAGYALRRHARGERGRRAAKRAVRRYRPDVVVCDPRRRTGIWCCRLGRGFSAGTSSPRPTRRAP